MFNGQKQPLPTSVDELADLPLADDGVADVEPAVLPLDGAVGVHGVAQPVVGRAAVLELLRAEAVRDVLDRVDEAVGVVVGRVDAPLVAGAVVGGILDPR